LFMISAQNPLPQSSGSKKDKLLGDTNLV